MLVVSITCKPTELLQNGKCDPQPSCSRHLHLDHGTCVLDPKFPEKIGVGGTSAVAPLWAGLIALLNQSLGKSVRFVNPILYKKALLRP
jgi:hypothetical protein